MNNNLRSRTDFIVVHSTKTKPSQNLNAKDITLLHRKEGFFHNAFHFVIKRDGLRSLQENKNFYNFWAHRHGKVFHFSI